MTISMNPNTGRVRLKRSLALAGLAGALLFTSCGTSGTGSEKGSSKPVTSAAPVDEDDGSEDVTPSGNGEQGIMEGEAVAHLPFDGTAPSGYKMVPDGCDPVEDDDGPAVYPSSITYAIPADWKSYGTSSGGSGSFSGTSIDLYFTTPDGDNVSIGYDWDNRGYEGEIIDWDGELWESFDYDSSIGDSETRIEYDKVATVSVGDQDVDLFYRDPKQSDNHISDRQYKVRVPVMTITNADEERGSVSPFSVVFELTFDKDVAAPSMDVLETIVGSFSLPTCHWDDELVMQEVLRNIDLNGDGKIKTNEEMQAEMAEMLEEMEAGLDDD